MPAIRFSVLLSMESRRPSGSGDYFDREQEIDVAGPRHPYHCWQQHAPGSLVDEQEIGALPGVVAPVGMPEHVLVTQLAPTFWHTASQLAPETVPLSFFVKTISVQCPAKHWHA